MAENSGYIAVSCLAHTCICHKLFFFRTIITWMSTSISTEAQKYQNTSGCVPTLTLLEIESKTSQRLNSMTCSFIYKAKIRTFKSLINGLKIITYNLNCLLGALVYKLLKEIKFSSLYL